MKKSGFIDSVRVKSPCSEHWDQMTGNSEVRFCSHCSKSVNNISEMTRKKALRLVRQSKGNLCIRYIEHPLTKAPVFTHELVQIARRASRVAAGVMTASLSLSALAYAQGGTSSRSNIPGNPTAEREDTSIPKTPSPLGSISGTVADTQGAVIPGATVSLIDANGKQFRSVKADAEGRYNFDEVPNGIYDVHIESPNFMKAVNKGLDVAGRTSVLNVTLEVGQFVALGGVMATTTREFEGLLAGAIAADDLEEVQDLISRGENVNRREEDRTTPLFIAVENGNIEIVRLLLQAGAKVNARDSDRETPLMQLGEEAKPELVELLISHGAKIELADEEGNTALIHAAENSNPEVVKALLDAGSKIDIQNDEGDTALIKAAYVENFEKVKLLVLAGADVNLKNKEGDTAWDQTGTEEIEAFLALHGAEVPPPEPEDSAKAEEP